MPFTELCIYQVKPQKTEEFEALMLEAKSFLEEQEGMLFLRLIKRGYHIDMEQIKEGLAPLKLTRIVKSVKYMLYWEFDTKENYGAAQKNLYNSYWIGPQAAFDCNVPIRVIHSHSTGNDCPNPYKRKLLDFLHNKYKKQLYKTANRFYACSKKAGLWMFPESIVESDKFKVIHNAVDTKKFAYNINTRQQMRKNLGVEDNFVIGHVGNFCYPKNYPFILDVVEAASKQNPKIRLLLAGTGPDFEHVQNLVKDKNLQNKVIFLGQRSDIHDIMQAMDVFLFPSRFEGLGIVLIEAQASGLPCVTSTAVPYEAAVTKSTIFLSLDDTIQKWVDTVCGFETYERVDKTDEIIAAGYDLAGEKEAYMSIIT